MARQRLNQRRTTTTERGVRLGSHLAALGLRTVEEYREFCERFGFGTQKEKSSRERRHEIEVRRRWAQADAEDRAYGAEWKNVADEILLDFAAEWRKRKLPAEVLRRAFARVPDCRRTRTRVERLLRHLRRYQFIFSAEPAVRELGAEVGNSCLEAAIVLALRDDEWVRPPEAWRPAAPADYPTFRSLVRHLHALWPVPYCLDAVWFMQESAEAERRRGWFLHVARGGNIRAVDLPLPYTKLMAHHFMQSPWDLTLEAALRWGQVHALGGDEPLARAVAQTRFVRDFSEYAFWESVLRWFIAHPQIDPGYVGPVVDYVYNRRFAVTERTVGARRFVVAPPEPNFTMKGRTPEGLLRAVERWHGRLRRIDFGLMTWAASGLPGLEFTEGKAGDDDETIWTIRELLSSIELGAEGRAMHHCVATYAGACAHGDSSIWSMESETVAERRKELTLEIHRRTRSIVQARGCGNALPTERQWTIVHRWAEQVGLKIEHGW